jgi:hypothetical protein
MAIARADLAKRKNTNAFARNLRSKWRIPSLRAIAIACYITNQRIEEKKYVN